MLAEALPVATDNEERQLLIDAARARLRLIHTELGPYAQQIKHYRGYPVGNAGGLRGPQPYGPTSVLWGRIPRGSAAMRRTDGRLARRHACLPSG